MSSTPNYALGFEELKDLADVTPEATPVAADSPFKMYFNLDGSLKRVVYEDKDARLAGQPFSRWSEEILKDPTTGRVTGIKTVRPSGAIVEEQFQYDAITGKLTGSILVRS